MLIKIMAFWDVIPCDLVDRCQGLGGTHPTNLHGVTSQTCMSGLVGKCYLTCCALYEGIFYYYIVIKVCFAWCLHTKGALERETSERKMVLKSVSISNCGSCLECRSCLASCTKTLWRIEQNLLHFIDPFFYGWAKRCRMGHTRRVKLISHINWSNYLTPL
jgi:hypothetical protein